MAERQGRLQPEVDYERNFSNDGYLEAKEEVHQTRRNQEYNQKVVRQTEISGNARANRKQQGVTNLTGNPNAIYSSTRADGTRMSFRTHGVPGVIEEASKEAAPIAPGEDIPWEMTIGASGESGSEQ